MLADPVVLLQNPSFRRKGPAVFPAGRQRDSSAAGLAAHGTGFQRSKSGCFTGIGHSRPNYLTAVFRFLLKTRNKNQEIVKTLWILWQSVAKQKRI